VLTCKVVVRETARGVAGLSAGLPGSTFTAFPARATVEPAFPGGAA